MRWKQIECNGTGSRNSGRCRKPDLHLFVWLIVCLRFAYTEANCTATGTGSFIPMEKRLVTCLMSDYDPLVRPAQYSNESIEVIVDSFMATIIDLDEKTSTLTTELWVYQSWVDVQLRWSEVDFPGVNVIHLPIERLWTPEIVLYNNADESYRYMLGKLAKVENNGRVTWIPHGRLKSQCQLDLTLFPFDTQRCELWMGPWSYDSSLVHLRRFEEEQGYREFLKKTSEWEVDGYSSHDMRVQHGNDTLSIVKFVIKMKRTSAFFKTMLVWPSALMAVLTLCLFWVPAASGERFMLATAILISLMLLMDILEGYLPTDIGRLPIVASYIAYNLALVAISIVLSIIVFNFYHRDARHSPVPYWIRKIFLQGYLSRMVCVSSVKYASVPTAGARGVESRHNPSSRRDRELHERLPGVGQSTTGRTFDDNEVDLSSASSYAVENPNSNANRMAINASAGLQQSVNEILRHVRRLADNCETNEHRQVTPSHSELVVGEWNQLAQVVDRLSFWSLTFITIVITIAFYFHV